MTKNRKYLRRQKLISIMIISLIMQLCMPPNMAFAAGEDFPFSVELDVGKVVFDDVKITTKEGIEVGTDASNPIDAKVGYQMEYSLHVDSYYSEKINSTTPSVIKLQIPKEFVIEATTIPIIAEGIGVKVAEVRINEDGSAELEFMETDESLRDYDKIDNLKFSIGIGIDEDEIGDSNEVVFEIFERSIAKSFYFKPYVEPPVEAINATLTKSGVFHAATNTIDWTITVNSKGNQLTTASVIHDMIDITKLDFVEIKDSAEIVIEASNYTYDSKTGALDYKLPGEFDAPYSITVSTKLKDDVFAAEGNKIIENTAVIEDAGLSVSNETTASQVIAVDWISKSGEEGTPIGEIRTIDWTVKVNANKRDIGGALFADEIPSGLELMADTVKIKVGDAPATSLVKALDIGELDETHYYYEALSPSVDNTFDATTQIAERIKYEFPDGTNDEYTITYTTRVTQDDILDSNTKVNFTNYAGLTLSGGAKYFAYGEAGVGTNLISKSGSYNRSNNRITWTIRVNSNKINLTNAVVTDIINSDEKFVDGSLTHNAEPGAVVSYVTDTKLLTVNLGDIGKNTKIITFQTEVVNPLHYATNYAGKWYRNVTELQASKDGKQLNNSTAYGDVYVTSRVIEKVGTSYNYSSKEMNWKLTVNQNKMLITDALITDNIPKGQSYVEDSFKLYNEAGTDVTSSSGEILLSETDKVETLTYRFGASITGQYTAVFKTKLDDAYAAELFAKSGDKILSNSATITGGDIPDGGVTVTASKTVANAVITKFGVQKDGLKDNPIVWTVVVNSNQIKINDGVITDKLSASLDFDANTVKLHEVSIDKDGNQTLGSEVAQDDFNKSNIIFDYDTNEVKFLLPSPTEKCYQLTFETEIVGATINISNLATFDGKGEAIDQSSEVQNVSVQISSGSAILSRRPGVIRIIKKDFADDKPLAGAEFEVIDSFGIVKGKIVTDEAGAGEINRLKIGETYTVSESKAPAGYDLDETPQVVTLVTQDDKDNPKELTFKDKATLRTVSFTKVSDDTNSVSVEGAQFRIFAKSDTDFSDPLWTAQSSLYGGVKFDKVIFGEYILKETKAPSGYVLNPQVYSVEVGKDGTVAIFKTGDTAKTPVTEIINQRVRADIQIKKIDLNSQLLKDAEFGLYRAPYSNADIPIETALTDENGIAKFKNILYGEYFVRETVAPIGYDLNEEGMDAKIISSDQVELTFVNKATPRTVILKKLSDIRMPVSGSQFSIFAKNDTDFSDALSMIKSDSEGNVVFNDVTFGEYTLKETKAPAGYVLNEQVYSVEVGKDGTVAIFKTGDTAKTQVTEIINQRVRADIVITKTDTSGSRLLEGAEFGLYREPYSKTDTPVETKVTDANGIATFKDIPYGNYFVLETVAPRGYRLNGEGKDANIISGDAVKLNFENRKKSKDLIIEEEEERSTPAQGGGGTNPATEKSDAKNIEVNPTTETDNQNTAVNPNAEITDDSASVNQMGNVNSGQTSQVKTDERATLIGKISKNSNKSASKDNADEQNEAAMQTESLNNDDPNANPKTGDSGLGATLALALAAYGAFRLKYSYKNETK